jgi:hypothetical protein
MKRIKHSLELKACFSNELRHLKIYENSTYFEFQNGKVILDRDKLTIESECFLDFKVSKD